MSFDLALGISGDELNSASQSVYTALYPRVFTGSQTVQYQGSSFTVAWDIHAAPIFDLSSPGNSEMRLAALQRRAKLARRPAGAPSPDLKAVADASPSFVVNFSTVALALTGGITTTLTLALTASCSVAISGSTISFVVNQLSAPPQSDPVTNYLVQTFVVPAIQNVLQTMFQGIEIPPLSVSGITLSIPSVGIVNNAVIVAANLQASGTPPPPDNTTPWPGTPFFALLGPNLVQQAMANALQAVSNQYSDSGGGGDRPWAGYDWGYSLSLASPSTSIDGSGNIDISFSLSGSVSGSVEVMYMSFGLGFNANGEPDPAVTLGVEVSGNSVELVTQNVQPFTIVVTPGSSVPDWVLGWLISAIIDAVVSSVTPLITQFLNGITIDGFDIPTYSVSVQGTTLTLTPSNLQPSNVAGYLAMTGEVTVS